MSYPKALTAAMISLVEFSCVIMWLFQTFWFLLERKHYALGENFRIRWQQDAT